MSALRHPLALLVLSALVAPGTPALADVIHKTDGTTVKDVEIVSESLQEVVYKSGRSERKLPSEEVLRVVYTKLPRPVQEAEAALDDDDVQTALDKLDGFVEEQIDKPSKRDGWAAPYAAWRSVSLRSALADQEGVIVSASTLIKNYADSRYVPMAFLAKAGAELSAGTSSDAEKTLQSFDGLIQSRGLSKRWDLECRIYKARANTSKKGDALRKTLVGIEAEAGDKFPIVRGRAKVARGESFLDEAEQASGAKKGELVFQAQDLFEEIIASPADDETLAAAYTGLGDCFLFAGAPTKDAQLLKQAYMAYLRVAINYPDQSQYVPKALYQASRCFDFLGEKRRSFEMRRELVKLYPNSSYAEKVR